MYINKYVNPINNLMYFPNPWWIKLYAEKCANTQMFHSRHSVSVPIHFYYMKKSGMHVFLTIYVCTPWQNMGFFSVNRSLKIWNSHKKKYTKYYDVYKKIGTLSKNLWVIKIFIKAHYTKKKLLKLEHIKLTCFLTSSYLVHWSLGRICCFIERSRALLRRNILSL